MEPLTVKDLYYAIQSEMKKGNENKIVMISSDDEGNGYHYLWYAFITGKEMEMDDAFQMSVNKNIASIEDTIVLG